MKLKKTSLLAALLCLGLAQYASGREMNGQLMVLVADFADGSVEYTYQFEDDEGNIFDLTGDETRKLPLLSEIPIHVDVTPQDDALHLDAFELGVDLSSEMAERRALNLGVRRAAAVIVDFATKKSSTTPAATAKLFNNMDVWFQTASLQKISFPVDSNGDGQPDVFGPYSVAVSESTCSYSNAAYLARQLAVKAGMRTDYQHEMYVLPQNIGCKWLGLAYIGCRDRCTLWTSSSDNLTVLAHEVGHNVGMHHAGKDPNDDTTLDSEYGDHSDIMGNYFTYAVGLNPVHHEQMGWYNTTKPNWLVTHEGEAGSEYEMQELAAGASSHVQTIKFTRPRGGSYYLAYRGAEGLDAGLKPEYKNKLGIYHWAGSAQSRWVATLAPGQSLEVGGQKIHFKGLNGNIATVVVGTPTAPPPAGQRLVAIHSNKCASLGIWNTLQQFTCDGSSKQSIETSPGSIAGAVLIKNAGKCLDIGGSSSADNATVHYTDCHGRRNQQFKLLPQSDGSYAIGTHAGELGKCLDVFASSLDDGARITQWSCSGSTNQRFRF